jgi:hypothetical protein
MNTQENVAVVLHIGRNSPSTVWPEADCTSLNNHSPYQFFQLFERTVPADQLMTITVMQLSTVVLYVMYMLRELHRRCTATHQFILDIAPEHSELTQTRIDVQSIAVSIAALQYVLANDQTPSKREGMSMIQLIYSSYTQVH